MEDQDAGGVVLAWLVGVVDGVDGELGEDGVVEQAAVVVVGLLVELVGVGEQREDVFEAVLDGAGVEVGLGEQSGGVGDVGAEVVLPVAEVLDGDGAGEVAVRRGVTYAEPGQDSALVVHAADVSADPDIASATMTLIAITSQSASTVYPFPLDIRLFADESAVAG